MPSSSSKPKTGRKSQRKQCGGVGRAQSLIPEDPGSSLNSTMKQQPLHRGKLHVLQGSDKIIPDSTLYTALCWNKYLLYLGVVTVVTGQQLRVDSVILRSG